MTPTSTTSGLAIRAVEAFDAYESGIKLTGAELVAVPLARHEFHLDRNYTIAPSNSP
ncbi:MAG: hypothetical protein M0T79_09785 [Actinomycetota bacterium]|nr:hypothetical protein [Actinomycetota bacterium]